MLLRRKTNKCKVLQYSSFFREKRSIQNRLTLQEIELLSHRYINEEVNQPAWSVQFKPKIREVLASSVSTSLSTAKSITAVTTSTIKESTRNTVERSSEKIVDVLTMPKSGAQLMIELASSSTNNLRRVIENAMDTLLIVTGKIRSVAIKIGNLVSKFIGYLYDNIVLILLIIFILIVSVITLQQTTILIINLFAS